MTAMGFLRRRIVKILRCLFGSLLRDICIGSPSIQGDKRLVSIHRTARVQNALFNVGCGRITVEENAFFGYNVCLLTGRHDVNKFDKERKQAVPREGCDIFIRRGAWVATNAIILGPCEVGEHAVVAAGSVVTKDVPPYHVVAGNPARVIRRIEPPQADVAGNTA
jgi:acetyltransferase-like isoleucine patch superfamily enzyme